ncbi:MAG: hypothetical protein FJ194_06475 [Gammaproteobacteria bacterium]|nr:hypothetical protein [Gammaproteobacteria bacterium]
MRIPDARLDEVRMQGFTVVEQFLDRETLAAAQEALWKVFPTPAQYFADPAHHKGYTRSQFAGMRLFPYPSWALNRLAILPDLVDAAERLCETKDLHLYKVEQKSRRVAGFCTYMILWNLLVGTRGFEPPTT